MSPAGAAPDTSLRAVLAGRRGRLLASLLPAEFAAAVQGIAYATVLPLAAGAGPTGRPDGQPVPAEVSRRITPVQLTPADR